MSNKIPSPPKPVILHGFTPDKLAVLITDAVVGGNFKTKGQARERVEELLRVFLKTGMSGKELNRQKHFIAIEKESLEKIFWQRKMKELHPDTIKEMYEELDKLLIQEGFKTSTTTIG